MPLTPYTNLIKVSGNTGKFPAKVTPGDEVSFRYSFSDAFQGSAGADDFAVTLGANFEVRDANGMLLLAWGFSVRYRIVVFLTLFTYYTEHQSLTVTYPVPAPVLIGDPNGITEPGGGSGYGLGSLDFLEAFETPIFVVNIPPDATVKIVFHTAGYPSLIDIAGLQVRTRLAGGNVSGFRHGRDGEAVVVFPSSGGVTQFRAQGRKRVITDAHPVLDTASGKPIASDGAVFVVRSDGHTSQFLYYSRGGSTYARISTSEGLKYGNEMALYPGHTLLGAAQFQRDGALLLLNDKAGKTYVGTRGKDGHFTAPALCGLPVGVALSSPGQLLCAGGTVDFFYTSKDGAEHLYSTNDGLTWKQSSATP